MRILIAQVTRMGDMLQTTPLIRALKHENPDARITVMVRDMGQIIAERNPDIDEVIVYNEDDMYRSLRVEDSDRLIEAYDLAAAFIEKLKAGNFDVAYNCTHSLTSTFLLKLAGIPTVVGAQLNVHHQYVIDGKGPACFFASVLHRQLSDLNLCDVFRHFAPAPNGPPGLVFEVTDADREAAHKLLAEHNIGADDLLVCMQLGASDFDKRWPAASFGALAKMLAEKHAAKVALLGVDSEAPLAEEFDAVAPGIAAHLFGKTNVPVLAAVLERANMLVSNDTGTMHIAAAVGCPVVLMSVGYVHFRETGPYAEGCVALERRRAHLGSSDIMKTDAHARVGIEPEHALCAVEFLLDGGRFDAWSDFTTGVDFENVDAYYSAFADDGCLAWYSLEPRAYRRIDFVRHVYRLTWMEYLHGKENDAAAETYLECARATHGPIDPDELDRWTKELSGEFDTLAELAGIGARKAQELAEGLAGGKPMKWAKTVVVELMSLDEDIRVYGEVHEACRPLVVLARFERENLQGNDPRQLAEATQAIYERLNQRALLAAHKTEFAGNALRQTGAPAAMPVRKINT